MLLLAGCLLEETGPTKHETVTIARDKSEMVRVELKMGAGEIRVRGGAQKLLEAGFTYNVDKWKPVVRYDNTGFRGNLTLEQPGKASSTGNTKYEWDLRFADDIPLDFTLHFGAGDARLNLGSMSLRSVMANIGVGRLELDLRGAPKKDYTVEVNGGVGEATIRLPKEAGIIATATGGIGGITARGLRKEGSEYLGEANEHADATIRVNVRGGVGAINLIAE
jgi:hypothetical protein